MSAIESIAADVLCEACGYKLTGLPPTAACPECGVAAADSLPSRRVGSPWQRMVMRGERRVVDIVAAYFVTGRRALAEPKRLAGEVIVGLRGAAGAGVAPVARVAPVVPVAPGVRSLLAVNLSLAAVLLSFGVGTVHAMMKQVPPASLLPTRLETVAEDYVTHYAADTTMLWRSFAAVVPIGLVLLAMTTMETFGLRTFGRQRGWRVSRQVAWAVVAHASFGWVVAGLLGMLTHALSLTPPGQMGLMKVLGWIDETWGFLNISGRFLQEWLPRGMGVLLGMLVFETLVYFGVRRCRFANRGERP